MHIVDEKFWLAIAFLTFAVLVVKCVWPTLSKMISNKSDQIAKDLKDAKEFKERAEALLTETQEQYKSTIKNAEKILLEARDEAKKYIEDSKEAVQDEIKRKIDSLNDRIKSEEEKAVRDIKMKIIEVAVSNVKKDLQDVDKSKFENVIKKSIGDISKLIH